jgi:hypothetical protein
MDLWCWHELSGQNFSSMGNRSEIKRDVRIITNEEVGIGGSSAHKLSAD